ncbi:MAG: ABC transporter permease [Deltaproteobacteria bacterium]|nr:ABC transporter permease [Deltaproteobacteria bacterium]
MARGTLRAAAQYAEIALILARRDFVRRYRGNVLGVLTTIAVPLLFLVTYAFVFSKVIPIKIRPGAGDTDYAFFLFAGLVGWNLFSETANRAPQLFVNQVHYIRKPLFPSSALVVASVLNALYHALLWVAAFAIARLVSGHGLSVSMLAAPAVLCLLAVFSVGVSLLVATVGVYVGDLAELMPPLLTLGFFLSPVLYSAERLAGVSPWLVAGNPMASQLELLRGVLLSEGSVGLGTAMASAVWALGALAIGVLVHVRARPLLADVV